MNWTLSPQPAFLKATSFSQSHHNSKDAPSFVALNEEVAYKRGRAREERVTKNGDSHAALNGSVLYRPFFVA
jgi:hypothetical protein